MDMGRAAKDMRSEIAAEVLSIAFAAFSEVAGVALGFLCACALSYRILGAPGLMVGWLPAIPIGLNVAMWATEMGPWARCTVTVVALVAFAAVGWSPILKAVVVVAVVVLTIPLARDRLSKAAKRRGGRR